MKAPKTIGEFNLYTKKPNTIDKGYYYQTELYFEVPNDFKNRMVRVYLPSDYNFNNPKKRYPVIYMTDGQNLCDEYLSGYGEWCVDETIERRLKNHKRSFIAVGLDCPYEEQARLIEMRVPCSGKYVTDKVTDQFGHEYVSGVGYADLLGDFILKVVKPLIDKTFYTLKTKKNTAVGGSSMGGLMAFYMGMKYKKLVGYSLCFSPAFLCYKDKYFQKELNKANLNPEDYGKFFLYTGGKDFDKEFIKLTFATYDILTKKGFGYDKLRLVFDSNCIHHEKPWSMYFPIAISFWLDETD